MPDAVRQIKERLSIVDVVSGYISVENSGNRLKARCPFHNEKTPSFYLSPDRNTYHCFGCGKGGDIFSFVEEMEGIEFKDALKLLAERAGVKIEYKEKSADDSKNLFSILEEAVQFFVAHLNTEVLDYLKERGLTEETIKTFAVGYAPDDWRALTTHLRGKGYTDAQLVLSGLAIKTEKGIYDRFRGRIMFPIADTQGRVVAFTGRILPSLMVSGVSTGNTPAKYVNSPETALFHKSDILFAYDKAKNNIRLKKRAVVVEGQMDVILCHQAGLTETVGVSGTALTDNHINLIKRFTENIVFCFDGDTAGMSASEKSIMKSLSLGCDTKVVFLKDGNDPADMVIANKEAFVSLIDTSKPVIDALINFAKESIKDIHELRKYVANKIVPYVRTIPKAMERAHYTNILARAVDLSDADIVQVINEYIVPSVPTNQKVDEHKKLSSIDRERMLAGYLFWNDELDIVKKETVTALMKTFLDIDVAEFCSAFETEKEVLISEAEFSTNKMILPNALKESILFIAEERLLAKSALLKQAIKSNSSDESLLGEYNRVIQSLDLVKNKRHEV